MMMLKQFSDISKGEITGYQNYAKYPESMKDAKEFIIKYREQRITE